MLTIISSSKYFPHQDPLCHPSRQLLPSCTWVRTTLHCRVQCYQNSLLFNTFLCICGVKLWVYFTKPSTIILQGNSLSRHTFLTLAFSPGLPLSSPPFLLLTGSLPARGPWGHDSHGFRSQPDPGGHSLPLQWGYGVINADRKRKGPEDA